MTSHAQCATIEYVNACVAALGDELGCKLDAIEKKRDKRHESLKEDLRRQGDNIVELQTDMTEVKTDVAGLKTDMAEVKATLGEHSRKLDDHGQKLDQIIGLLRAS